MEIETIHDVLADIQHRLKAPKGQVNEFGRYKYRSCEDILTAVKPLLAEHQCSLVISDEIVECGDRYYVKATAILHWDRSIISSSASAREPEQKKGMDEAQITGATSSYARKYALNGLFAIDDTRDPDSADNRDEGQPKYNEKQKALFDALVAAEDALGLYLIRLKDEDLYTALVNSAEKGQKVKLKNVVRKLEPLGQSQFEQIETGIVEQDPWRIKENAGDSLPATIRMLKAALPPAAEAVIDEAMTTGEQA